MDASMETNEIAYNTGGGHNLENWAPPPPDQNRIDSFERVLEQFKTQDVERRTDSDNSLLSQLILQELRTTNFGTELSQDVGMDSIESIPSSVINSALNILDRTSLPHVDGNEITQAFLAQASQRYPYGLNETILVSPSNHESEATYHDLQTRPLVDPNQEIHGGPISFYNNTYQQPVPEQSSEPQRFLQATTTNQIDGQIPRRDDDVISVQSTDSMESNAYQLSAENSLEITVSYSTLPVCGTVKVDRPEGCIMFYKKASQDMLDRCQLVSFPSLEKTEVRKKFEKVSPKALELTERALNALQGGLQLYWKPNVGVYATRRSRGKIYWTSTQLTTTEPQELIRNNETLVFDWDTFRKVLTTNYALKAMNKSFEVNPVLPSIIFTFAQKWCKDTAPVTSCLVWGKVVPKKAEEMMLGLFPRAKSAAHSKHNSGMLKISVGLDSTSI